MTGAKKNMIFNIFRVGSMILNYRFYDNKILNIVGEMNVPALKA